MPMPALLPILLTASHVVLAADGVPVFDVMPSCRAAGQTPIGPGRGTEACLRDENEARAKLDRDWAKFQAADRTHCVRLTMLDGTPSYVEVLTCLEMARDAREPPADTPRRR
jgi:hypothetical protein